MLIIASLLAMPRALFPEAAAIRFHGGVGLLYSSIAAGSVLAGLSSGWIGRIRRQGVALTGALDARLRSQPLTRALLTAPFPAAKAAVAPVYRSIEQFSYTVSTCI